MNATEFLPAGTKKARVEIIPLIDVVFFLLATFVLFTLSLDRIAALTMDPPRPGPPKEEDRTVFIQTSDPGLVYWKEGSQSSPELVSLTEVPSRLSEYVHRVSMPRVLVRGDRKAKFGDAIQVFDQVRAAGIKQVSIETLTSPTGK